MKDTASTLKIYFENSQDKEPVDEALEAHVRSAITATLEFECINESCEVSVTFVDNDEIRALNAQYRGIDSATDVLSFPLEEFEDEEYDDKDDGEESEAAFDEPLMLGDIVLSLERAREQAELYGHGFDREVAFLCVHSTLHLLGYDHETGDEDEMDMRARQRAILESMGLSVGGDVK
ncbi:MAG: rRNA maturation RNase YbeY [Clostridia bacterium]|nr:rRNA maturation RNase YbeY [Clostridia bacterium]